MKNYIKVGDLVCCVDNNGNKKHLTINKIYKVLSINTYLNKYGIIADDGNQYDFFVYRFVKYVNKKNHLPVWF